MLAVAMTLPLFMYLGIQSGQSVLGKLNESPQITVYMDTDAASSDADTVKNLLQRDSRIDKVRFISKREGLEELQTNLDQNLVSMLDGNPLPDVFIVTPDPAASPDQMQAIYKDITKLPRVESATMDTEWVQTLYRINEFIRKILWFLSLTLGMAFVLVANQHHPPANPQPQGRVGDHQAVGCSCFLHPPPFPLSGQCGRVFSPPPSAWALSAWLLAEVRPLVDAIFKPYGLNIGWRFFTFSEVSLVFGFVIALGVFGAWLATTQHLLGFKAKNKPWQTGRLNHSDGLKSYPFANLNKPCENLILPHLTARS